MEAGPVKNWLHSTAALLRRVFAASNTYRSLHTLYEELGLFGTASSIVLPNFENVLHHYPLTIGEYALGHGCGGSGQHPGARVPDDRRPSLANSEDNVSTTVRSYTTRAHTTRAWT